MRRDDEEMERKGTESFRRKSFSGKTHMYLNENERYFQAKIFFKRNLSIVQPSSGSGTFFSSIKNYFQVMTGGDD